jgi:hypothetical protein
MKTEVLREIFALVYVHHKSHMDCPGTECTMRSQHLISCPMAKPAKDTKVCYVQIRENVITLNYSSQTKQHSLLIQLYPSLTFQLFVQRLSNILLFLNDQSLFFLQSKISMGKHVA